MSRRKKTEKLIDDFFHNRIPAKDFKVAIRLLAEESDADAIENVMRKHWLEEKRSHVLNEEQYKLILDTIHRRINLSEASKSQVLPPKDNLRGFGYNLSRTLMKVAAILFIPLLVSTLFYMNKQTSRNKAIKSVSFSEVHTPVASRTRFLLPDSTLVWLNAGSSLRFPSSFNGKTRTVSLTGEGYFEVAKNEKVPFIVETSKMNVLALGTTFNIMAYPGGPEVQATLVSGKVKVENTGTGECCILNPSDQVVLDVNRNEMTVSQVVTDFYTSWKDGKLVFRNTPLEIVAKKLERWYNCTIYIQDDGINKSRYTGNIEMESLMEVMELIKLTTPINSRFNPETREIWIEPR